VHASFSPNLKTLKENIFSFWDKDGRKKKRILKNVYRERERERENGWGQIVLFFMLLSKGSESVVILKKKKTSNFLSNMGPLQIRIK
jgi:hypothetical protein